MNKRHCKSSLFAFSFPALLQIGILLIILVVQSQSAKTSVVLVVKILIPTVITIAINIKTIVIFIFAAIIIIIKFFIELMVWDRPVSHFEVILGESGGVRFGAQLGSGKDWCRRRLDAI